MYDKDFRIHMSKHPERNWSIKLQQAWALRLREKHQHYGNQSNNQFNHSNMVSSRGHSDEPCRRYNRGRCPFGSDCRYDHRCSYCFKMGHAIINFRKLAADKERERACSGYASYRERKESDKGCEHHEYHKRNNGHDMNKTNDSGRKT